MFLNGVAICMLSDRFKCNLGYKKARAEMQRRKTHEQPSINYTRALVL
jgi:hypothetical protein